MPRARDLRFRGRSHEDLRSFPASVRERVGYDLWQVQLGGEARDWKPMKTIGSGVNEIRVREESGAYRVIYIAKFEEAIYVLHCFEKKSQGTSRSDLELATARYGDLLRERSRR